MKEMKVPFAYLDGTLVDIQTAKKKVPYKCSCGSEVRLRGGDHVSDHFYHTDNSNCSYESAIHKAYKERFQKLKKIKLPYKINGKYVLEFDRVDLEKQIDDYIPDAIGYIGDTRYLIEFAKSSYIKERKKRKIKKTNLFCIEVDLTKTITSIKQIDDHIIKEGWYKHIIHIPEYWEMTELREKFKKAYLAIKDNLREIEDKYDQLKELTKLEKVTLRHITTCKNGAEFYKTSWDSGGEIVAFLKGNSIDIKYQNNKTIRQQMDSSVRTAMAYEDQKNKIIQVLTDHSFIVENLSGDSLIVVDKDCWNSVSSHIMSDIINAGFQIRA